MGQSPGRQVGPEKHIIPHIIVWGSCFWISTSRLLLLLLPPPPPPPPPPSLSHIFVRHIHVAHIFVTHLGRRWSRVARALLWRWRHPLSAKGERKREHGAMCHVLSLPPLDAAIMSANCMVGVPLAASAVKQLSLACFHLFRVPSCPSLCTFFPYQADRREVVCHLVGRGCGMMRLCLLGARPSMTARVMR